MICLLSTSRMASRLTWRWLIDRRTKRIRYYSMITYITHAMHHIDQITMDRHMHKLIEIFAVIQSMQGTNHIHTLQSSSSLLAVLSFPPLLHFSMHAHRLMHCICAKFKKGDAGVSLAAEFYSGSRRTRPGQVRAETNLKKFNT